MAYRQSGCGLAGRLPVVQKFRIFRTLAYFFLGFSDFFVVTNCHDRNSFFESESLPQMLYIFAPLLQMNMWVSCDVH